MTVSPSASLPATVPLMTICLIIANLTLPDLTNPPPQAGEGRNCFGRVGRVMLV